MNSDKKISKDDLKYILKRTTIKDNKDHFIIEYKDLDGKRISIKRSYVRKQIKEEVYEVINKVRNKLIKEYSDNIENNLKLEKQKIDKKERKEMIEHKFDYLLTFD